METTPEKKGFSLPNLESSLKILGFLLSAVTLYWGVFQYKENNERTFRKSVFDQQMRVYTDYLTLCSILANTDKDSTYNKDFEKNYAAFERLHYGEMTLVQDTAVCLSATRFYVSINSFRQRTSSTTNFELKRCIDDLSINIRRSLRDTWTKDFNKLFIK